MRIPATTTIVITPNVTPMAIPTFPPVERGEEACCDPQLLV